MSWRVQFAPEALDQLDAIEDYIAHAGSPAVAVRYVDAIVAYCESLSAFPERGIRRDDLLPGLRITNYRRNAVIAFVVDSSAEAVTILGVFYGGRDYEAVLQDESGGGAGRPECGIDPYHQLKPIQELATSVTH